MQFINSDFELAKNIPQCAWRSSALCDACFYFYVIYKVENADVYSESSQVFSHVRGFCVTGVNGYWPAFGR